VNEWENDESLDDPLPQDLQSLDQTGDSFRFKDFVRVCPKCKQTVTEDMDSCPFCGDILFRYLQDGTFAPRKGPLIKIVSLLIILVVVLAILGLLWVLIIP
jgi:hypothetical protein